MSEKIKSTKEKANFKGSGDWAWTGEQSFTKLVEHLIEKETDPKFAVFIAEQHMLYKEASTYLHSGVVGNISRIGTEPDFLGVDNRAKTRGQELALLFAVQSFIAVVGVTCRELKMESGEWIFALNDLGIFYREKCKELLGITDS